MGYIILETAKLKKKSSKTAQKNSDKTENLIYSQNRKTQLPHWIIKPKNRYYFLRKPDAKKRKIRKPKRTPKPKNRSLLAQKPKNRSKKLPKPKIPMCPSLRQARALPLLFESKKPLHLTAPFNAVVFKRIWLRILIVTNK